MEPTSESIRVDLQKLKGVSLAGGAGADGEVEQRIESQ